MFQRTELDGNSLVVQRLGLDAITAKGLGSISGQGTEILQAARHGQKMKKKKKKTKNRTGENNRKGNRSLWSLTRARSYKHRLNYLFISRVI